MLNNLIQIPNDDYIDAVSNLPKEYIEYVVFKKDKIAYVRRDRIASDKADNMLKLTGFRSVKETNAIAGLHALTAVMIIAVFANYIFNPASISFTEFTWSFIAVLALAYAAHCKYQSITLKHQLQKDTVMRLKCAILVYDLT